MVIQISAYRIQNETGLDISYFLEIQYNLTLKLLPSDMLKPILKINDYIWEILPPAFQGRLFQWIYYLLCYMKASSFMAYSLRNNCNSCKNTSKIGMSFSHNHECLIKPFIFYFKQFCWNSNSVQTVLITCEYEEALIKKWTKKAGDSILLFYSRACKS